MREPYSYKSDPSIPAFPDDRPIIVFDGHCVLCSRWARFVLRHDTSAHYRLLPAQTDLGHAIYAHYGLDPENYQTNILIENGVAWFKSESSVRMFVGLGWPWSAARAFRVLPMGWRDALYELVARNRFNWFGRREECMLSQENYEDRFLP